MVWGNYIRSFDYHFCLKKIQKQKHPPPFKKNGKKIWGLRRKINSKYSGHFKIFNRYSDIIIVINCKKNMAFMIQNYKSVLIFFHCLFYVMPDHAFAIQTATNQDISLLLRYGNFYSTIIHTCTCSTIIKYYCYYQSIKIIKIINIIMQNKCHETQNFCFFLIYDFCMYVDIQYLESKNTFGKT